MGVTDPSFGIVGPLGILVIDYFVPLFFYFLIFNFLFARSRIKNIILINTAGLIILTILVLSSMYTEMYTEAGGTLTSFPIVIANPFLLLICLATIIAIYISNKRLKRKFKI